MFRCCDCKNIKVLTEQVCCSICKNFTCITCVKGSPQDNTIVCLCKLCDMKEKAVTKYNDTQTELTLFLLCEEIENESKGKVVEEIPVDLSKDLSFKNEEKLDFFRDKKFQSILNFWCDSPWWWDEEQFVRFNELNQKNSF